VRTFVRVCTTWLWLPSFTFLATLVALAADAEVDAATGTQGDDRHAQCSVSVCRQAAPPVGYGTHTNAGQQPRRRGPLIDSNNTHSRRRSAGETRRVQQHTAGSTDLSAFLHHTFVFGKRVSQF
jgi:hypothetical protein